MLAQVIDILMTADLSGDSRMDADSMAGPAPAGPARWAQNGPASAQHQGHPPHHQVALSACMRIQSIMSQLPLYDEQHAD